MNFFTLLKQEHKEAKEAFETLLEQEEIDQKLTLELCQKLLLHMEMEEKYFYPLAKKNRETKELSEEASLEHEAAKKVMKELQSGKLDDIEFKVKLEILQLEIEHHVEEEENELLPKSKRILSEEQIKDITQKMVALKEKKLKSHV